MYQKLLTVFDFVGIISKERYAQFKPYGYDEYETIFVVGLSYPSTPLPKKKDAYVASMYTYGLNYHTVIKARANQVIKDDMLVLVDNHTLDERLALSLTGLAYLGKNDLMIHKDYGSYFFIGLILSKRKYEEVIVENNDSCLDCTICIEACPVGALLGGFDIDKCMSAYNQTKRPLKEEEISKNYLLLGCDICQRVCPKNKNIKESMTFEFYPKDHTYVLIEDLFTLSNKQFAKKYGQVSYLWRGKTLLLRNALTLLLKDKNTQYNDLIKKTIQSNEYPSWYKEDAKKILIKLGGQL